MVEVEADVWLAILVIKSIRACAMEGGISGARVMRLATWSCNGFLVREKRVINILSQAVGIKQTRTS